MTALPEWLKCIRGDYSDDSNEPLDMLLQEPIGYNPQTGEGISANRFGQVLNGVKKGRVVNLLINTMGGAVDQGTAMHNMILARGNVHTVVVGYAASMGAVIAQAGVTRKMMPGTMMIIHNPQAATGALDADQMEDMAGTLRKVKDSLVNLFAERSGTSRKKISDMMDATTMMDPDEACELGFCDEIVSGSPAFNDLSKVLNVLSPAQTAKSFRQLTINNQTVAAGAPQPKKETDMKLITSALAAAGLIQSADLTDEAAVVSQFRNALGNMPKKADVDALQSRLDGFEAERKTRITNTVRAAVESKLVKPERETAMIEMGLANEANLTNYIADLTELKNSAQPAPAPQPRRGAAPLPPTPQQGESDNETKMANLRNELTTKITPERRYAICNELRTLRGHGDLFKVTK